MPKRENKRGPVVTPFSIASQFTGPPFFQTFDNDVIKRQLRQERALPAERRDEPSPHPVAKAPGRKAPSARKQRK